MKKGGNVAFRSVYSTSRWAFGKVHSLLNILVRLVFKMIRCVTDSSGNVTLVNVILVVREFDVIISISAL